MKKMKKVLSLIAIIFLIGIIYFFSSPVVANAANSSSSGGFLNALQSTNNWLNNGQAQANAKNVTINYNPVVEVAQLLYTIGCVVVLTGTIYLAIKYGVSGPAERALIKGKLIGWGVTAIIIVGGVQLFRLIGSLLTNGSNTFTSIANQLSPVSNGLPSSWQNTMTAKVLNTIVRMFQVFGIGYALIRVTCDAIRLFVVSGRGIPGEIEKAKNTLTRSFYVAIPIFGASAIFEIIWRIVLAIGDLV